MQIILTDADLERMPTWLKRDLVLFLVRAHGAMAAEAAEAEPEAMRHLALLNRAQALALIRNVSFGNNTRILHDLLMALAYEKESEAPTPDHLITKLHLKDERQLGRHLKTLTRLVRLVTHDHTAQLTRSSGAGRAFLVHPVSRDVLRDSFSILARSGENEEPLWA